jgi:DNA-binding transcriptional LysR family regulator
MLAQLKAVLAGAGIGVVPFFMAHGEKKLISVLPDQSIERDFWLQFNPDSKHIARVRATINFIVNQIKAEEELFLAPPSV